MLISRLAKCDTPFFRNIMLLDIEFCVNNIYICERNAWLKSQIQCPLLKLQITHYFRHRKKSEMWYRLITIEKVIYQVSGTCKANKSNISIWHFQGAIKHELDYIISRTLNVSNLLETWNLLRCLVMLWPKGGDITFQWLHTCNRKCSDL